jgi:PiT family inorganic phosphate transporter
VYLLFRSVRKAAGVTRQTCICLDGRDEPVQVNADGSLVVRRTGVQLAADDARRCLQRYDGRVLGVHIQGLVNGAHLVSAGALSFARGLNDTPKIAALLIAVDLLARPASLALTGLAIAAGGLLMVWRVARTMSWRITAMNEGQAFSANLVAASLVTSASLHGLPVSTTHVSCGSLFGIGLAGRSAHWPMIGRIILAWVTTLPVAAALGYVLWRCLGSPA